MRWYLAVLWKSTVTGRDAIGNPTATTEKAGRVLVRPSPLTPQLSATEGNAAHVTERLFVTKAPAEALRGVVTLVVRGRAYSVDRVDDCGSTALIRAHDAKGGRWESESASSSTTATGSSRS